MALALDPHVDDLALGDIVAVQCVSSSGVPNGVVRARDEQARHADRGQVLDAQLRRLARAGAAGRRSARARAGWRAAWPSTPAAIIEHIRPPIERPPITSGGRLDPEAAARVWAQGVEAPTAEAISLALGALAALEALAPATPQHPASSAAGPETTGPGRPERGPSPGGPLTAPRGQHIHCQAAASWAFVSGLA